MNLSCFTFHVSCSLIMQVHQNPILPTDLFFFNFCQLSKFKINWIVFAGTFTSALNKPSNLRKIGILSINQSNAKINKRMKYWPIRLQLLSLLSNSGKQLLLAEFYCVLIMAEISDFSLHLFDDSDFQIQSSARVPEMDATDLLKMWKNNQNQNTQRTRKTWIKAFDLYSMPLQNWT